MRHVAVMLVMYLAAGAVGAEGIYKWVDAQGQVHYGDRPGGAGAQKLNVTPDAVPADAADAARREQQNKLLRSFDEQRAYDAQQQAKRDAAAAQRAQNCRRARVDLENYSNAAYLYERDAQGHKRIFSDAERERALAQLRQKVERWCGD